MKTIGKILREKGVLLVLAGILCVYFGAICLINFSGRPGFYCTDMYTDMVFAAKAWDQKALIPDGWLFGNQLYVVATPALAALYCGLALTPQMAMALAAVTMTVLTLATFWWMLKAVFPSGADSLLCIVLFMALGLFFGDSVGTVNGWQLFFTMCAYYGCYLLNVLLAFGCYLHADGKKKNNFWILLGITCILSFGTGMQSLRQTAVMSGPLMAMAGFRFVQDLRKKENWRHLSVLTACVITVSNLLGLFYKETVEFQQTEIFGEMKITTPDQILPAVAESMDTMMELLHCETSAAVAMRIVLLLLCGFAVVVLCIRGCSGKDCRALELGGLIMLSVLAIQVIDVFTTLEVRSIYYFMLYLMAAFLCTYLFSGRGALCRWLSLGVMILLLILPGMLALKDICMQAWFAEYDSIYEVSNYLTEKGYTTVYSAWNMGEDIAVASDFEIEAGFWDEDIFVPVTYLCDPAVYEADSDCCVYAMFGQDYAQRAEQVVLEKGLDFNLIEYFPNSNVYLYTSSANLMQEFAQ